MTGTSPLPASAYADGRCIVLPAGAALPMLCVKCAQPASLAIMQSVRWRSRSDYATALLTAGHFIPGGMGATIPVPLCAEHARSPRRARVYGWLTFVAGVAAWIFIANRDFQWSGWTGAAVGLALIVRGLIFDARAGGPLRAVYIDKDVARLKGACEAYLRLLPPWPSGATLK